MLVLTQSAALAKVCCCFDSIFLLSTNSDGIGYHIKHGYRNARFCLKC